MTVPEAERSVRGAQSIFRALDVLEILRDSSGDVGLTEIAEKLSLHASTTHRILRALSSAGYVVQSSTNGRFRLGRFAFLLGRAAERDLGFDAVLPVLEDLRDQTEESVNLVIRDGQEGLVVLRVESRQPLRFTQPAGTRLPLYCTSTGKVMLAFATDVNAEIAMLGELRQLTDSTIVSNAQLLVELEEIHQQGYGINRGERIEGVCGVAAPVFGPAKNTLAVIAVQGPQVRMPDKRIAELGGMVIETAHRVAEVLPQGFRI